MYKAARRVYHMFYHRRRRTLYNLFKSSGCGNLSRDRRMLLNNKYTHTHTHTTTIDRREQGRNKREK
jgi:hypothetical protein